MSKTSKPRFTVYAVTGQKDKQHPRIGRWVRSNLAYKVARQHSRHDAACTIVCDGVTIAKFRNGQEVSTIGSGYNTDRAQSTSDNVTLPRQQTIASGLCCWCNQLATHAMQDHTLDQTDLACHTHSVMYEHSYDAVREL